MSRVHDVLAEVARRFEKVVRGDLGDRPVTELSDAELAIHAVEVLPDPAKTAKK